MKKLFLLIFLFAGISVYAQDESGWFTDYHGSKKTFYSNRLTIAVNDSTTGVYYIVNNLIAIQVDSNWTASGVGFEVWNALESRWDLVTKDDGTTYILPVAIGKAVPVDPTIGAAIKEVRFAKLDTSTGAYVKEATAAGKLIVTSRKY